MITSYLKDILFLNAVYNIDKSAALPIGLENVYLWSFSTIGKSISSTNSYIPMFEPINPCLRGSLTSMIELVDVNILLIPIFEIILLIQLFLELSVILLISSCCICVRYK